MLCMPYAAVCGLDGRWPDVCAQAVACGKRGSARWYCTAIKRSSSYAARRGWSRAVAEVEACLTGCQGNPLHHKLECSATVRQRPTPASRNQTNPPCSALCRLLQLCPKHESPPALPDFQQCIARLDEAKQARFAFEAPTHDAVLCWQMWPSRQPPAPPAAPCTLAADARPFAPCPPADSAVGGHAPLKHAHSAPSSPWRCCAWEGSRRGRTFAPSRPGSARLRAATGRRVEES